MIRTILIDDEAPARDELRYLLTTNHQNVIQIISEADNATDAITLITKEQPDLVFLDIHMRGLSGLEIAEIIQNVAPRTKIIFATAYDEYALKAFELHALDYVVKPIEEERLAKSIARIVQEKEPHPNNQNAEVTSKTKRPNTILSATELPEVSAVLPKKIAVEHEGHIFLVELDSILFITGESGHLEVHTTEGMYYSNKTLTELQNRLQGTTLCRVHRSYIVNLNEVSEVVPWFKGTYWLRLPNISIKDGKKVRKIVDIPISKTQVKTIKELLGIT